MSDQTILLCTVAFGITSTLLYIGWAVFSYFTPQKYMTGALLFYAGANVFLLWPTILAIK